MSWSTQEMHTCPRCNGRGSDPEETFVDVSYECCGQAMQCGDADAGCYGEQSYPEEVPSQCNLCGGKCNVDRVTLITYVCGN